MCTTSTVQFILLFGKLALYAGSPSLLGPVIMIQKKKSKEGSNIGQTVGNCTRLQQVTIVTL